MVNFCIFVPLLLLTHLITIEMSSFHEIAKDLRENYEKLTEFESLTLAIQIERNQILKAGLNVSSSDAHPSALEAIAISLGYTDGQFKDTISNVLKRIESK